MRLISVVALSAATLCFSSCAKNNGHQPGTPVDSTGNQVMVDTALQKKTTRQYLTTEQPPVHTDSLVFHWTYDHNGRVTSEVGTRPGYYDSASIVYSLNPETVRTEHYYSVTLLSQIIKTYYRSGGRLDSMSTKGFQATGTGALGYDRMTYYAYDGQLHDTLERCVESITGTPTTQYVLHYIYTDGKLDSTIDEQPEQHTRIAINYVDGAATQALTYVYDIPKYTDSYTYTNTPSGGYYNFTGTPYLLQQTVHAYAGTGIVISTQSFSYTLDAKNRVIEMSGTFVPKFIDTKEYYTYF